MVCLLGRIMTQIHFTLGHHSSRCSVWLHMDSNTQNTGICVGFKAEAKQEFEPICQKLFLTINYPLIVFLNIFLSVVHDNSKAIFLSACFPSYFLKHLSDDKGKWGICNGKFLF